MKLITITRSEYAKLLKSQYILISLENGGVDNWQDHGLAMLEKDDSGLNAYDIKDMDDDSIIELLGHEISKHRSDIQGVS